MQNKINSFLVIICAILIPWQFYFNVFANKSATIFFFYSFALCLYLFLQKKIDIKILLEQKAFFILFALIAIFALFSDLKIEGLKYIYYFIIAFPVLLIFRSEIINKEKIISAYLWSSLPLALLAITLFFANEHKTQLYQLPFWSYLIEPDTLKDAITNPYAANAFAANRGGGVFLNTQDGAVFACINILLSIWLIINKRKKIYFISAIIWILSLIAFGSRAGLIIFIVVAIFASILLFHKLKQKRMRKRYVLLPIFAAFFLLFSSILINQRFYSAGLDQAINFNGRIKIWTSSIEVIKDNCVLGVGFDNNKWNNQYNNYAQKINAILSVPPHNIYLLIWAKIGVFGAIFLLAFILWNFKRELLIYLQKDSNTYTLHLALTLIFLWIGLQGLTENLFLAEARILASLFMLLGLNKNENT